ncbi:MAG: pyridoxal phosphate-dependent aminotransferase [Ahrensia sp.]|nr:pyridoxal phosphate-dependent aminotransferase [Ahrensia sp.]
MATASVLNRVAALGTQRWAVHFMGRQRALKDPDFIELTIGEPDLPMATDLIGIAEQAMRSGRTRYSVGKGEPALLEALARKYSARTGRDISPAHFLAFPGTQAALAIVMQGLVEAGDAVLVPDPNYATYEGVVRMTGADFVPVPMDAANGFRLTADQLRDAMVPNAKVLLLNNPHNPTGAVLSREAVSEIGSVCREHGLWIISDEVYETLIYGHLFASPFDEAALADHTITVSSISKSHAAPGFRSGWAAGPPWVMDRIQPLSEALLFGNQPFIADMTVHALDHPGTVGAQMAAAYQKRITTLMKAFERSVLKPLKPQAGMFMLVDVSATGLDGEAFARRLLENGVSVMPGTSFGTQAASFVRLSLTVPEDRLLEAAQRMVAMAS